MEPFEKKASNSNKYLIIFVVIALIGGFWGGHAWTKRQYPVINAEGFDLLQASYNKIQDNYLYGADSGELIDGAIAGMVSSLGDQYSQYLADEAGENYADSYNKNFYGIGAEVQQKDGKFFISTLVKDMPAEKVGLKPADQIVTVDQQSVEGYTLNELLSKVRGKKGTSVVVGIKRGESITDFNIERAEIPVHTVTLNKLDNNIGMIAISRFTEATDVEFKEALASLMKDGNMKGLIIDLRSNPGGLLNQTVEIANVLVPNGKKILDVVYKNEEKTISFNSKQDEPFNTPIVVLVNQYSASASEVLAAALKESANARIVGVKTYGKGVVQTYEQFYSGSVLVLTEAEWKTPSGSGIHKIGVEPTDTVELPDYANLKPVSNGVELKLNSFGDDVIALQKILLVLGYSPSNNGLYDEETVQAVKQYESAKGISVDGIYTDEVGNLLVQDVRSLLQANDYQLQKAVQLLKK
ncbi:S41 family peptidase [Paenibacillus endoradicis]|uniref:S41 family peptidase n=1 Tax=Paenibacillus endoradicis TaxID=2972487 RepID=UPI002158EA20|nr:S41 family peptidase [Paenibacillus endoradicis]MCR8657879.1 S41 family peptidase [Paenibacillus endoradicis]